MDNGVIRNHILLAIVERLKIPYRLKENLYPLVTILENPIFYKSRVICIKIEPLELRIKGWRVIINFNILLLGNNKVVLKIP